MDSYTTDAVSLAKKISAHRSVTISAVMRVIDVHNFMFDFFPYAYDIQISYSSENYNKHLVGCSVFLITNGHRICAHTAE